MKLTFSNSFVAVLLLMMSVVLTGCESIETEAKYPTGLDRSHSDDIYEKPEGIFGKDGLSILGGDKKDNDDGASGIGVNSFLWRASLDTVSFMPIASADPFGGVILTDWYMPDVKKGERFKLNVFIMGRHLRSDGIRVRAFKQVLRGSAWVDAPVDKETAVELEDTILTRARQLRVSGLSGEE